MYAKCICFVDIPAVEIHTHNPDEFYLLYMEHKLNCTVDAVPTPTNTSVNWFWMSCNSPYNCSSIYDNWQPVIMVSSIDEIWCLLQFVGMQILQSVKIFIKINRKLILLLYDIYIVRSCVFKQCMANSFSYIKHLF